MSERAVAEAFARIMTAKHPGTSWFPCSEEQAEKAKSEGRPVARLASEEEKAVALARLEKNGRPSSSDTRPRD